MTNSLIHVLILIAMPPLLPGVIAKTKAFFAGRVGPPVFQLYYDLWKLVHKDFVTSRTTTWVFAAGPVACVVVTILAGLLVPMGTAESPIHFTGDMILFAYLLALGRFFTSASALDTGSAFEGMGAARDVSFACLAEPALFLALLALGRLSQSLSLSGMLDGALTRAWPSLGAALIFVMLGLFIILLAENCRMPFDDPNTHLELTMIHEVMVAGSQRAGAGNDPLRGRRETLRSRHGGPPGCAAADHGLRWARCCRVSVGDAAPGGPHRRGRIGHGPVAPGPRTQPVDCGLFAFRFPASCFWSGDP